jgi:hypothetical protein
MGGWLNDLPLIIRADATAETGAGHVMRCASLAAAWTAATGSAGIFVGRIEIPFVLRQLAQVGALLESSEFSATDGALVVVDSYDAGTRASWARAPGAVLRVLIDDVGAEVPDGFNVVLNPNPYATEALYPSFAGELLAGGGAVLLREGLPAAKTGVGTGVLLGGGGPSRVLLSALERLSETAALGPWAAVGEWAPAGWRTVPSDGPWGDLSSRARLLVAAGSATWESASVGVPVALVEVADNQRLVADWARQQGTPVVRVADYTCAATLTDALRNALVHARKMPVLKSGSQSVVTRLIALAARGPG